VRDTRLVLSSRISIRTNTLPRQGSVVRARAPPQRHAQRDSASSRAIARAQALKHTPKHKQATHTNTNAHTNTHTHTYPTQTHTRTHTCSCVSVCPVAGRAAAPPPPRGACESLPLSPAPSSPPSRPRVVVARAACRRAFSIVDANRSDTTGLGAATDGTGGGGGGARPPPPPVPSRACARRG
jgi:hypothetical protein